MEPAERPLWKAAVDAVAFLAQLASTLGLAFATLLAVASFRHGSGSAPWYLFFASLYGLPSLGVLVAGVWVGRWTGRRRPLLKWATTAVVFVAAFLALYRASRSWDGFWPPGG